MSAAFFLSVGKCYGGKSSSHIINLKVLFLSQRLIDFIEDGSRNGFFGAMSRDEGMEFSMVIMKIFSRGGNVN